jgi:hypothetical protein
VRLEGRDSGIPSDRLRRSDEAGGFGHHAGLAVAGRLRRGAGRRRADRRGRSLHLLDLPASRSFLQAGHPALFGSDSSFSAYYPWYHEPTDTKDKLDAAALARMGQGVLGVVRALGNVKPGPRAEPQWFAAFGQVFGASVLLAVGALSLVPGLLRGLASGGLGLGARLAFSILFALLLWRQPVPALWIFLLPNLLVVVRGGWARVDSLGPALLLLGLGLAAARRGYASGLWLAPWEVALFGLAVLLAVIVPAAPVRSSRSLPRKAPRPGPRR